MLSAHGLRKSFTMAATGGSVVAKISVVSCARAVLRDMASVTAATATRKRAFIFLSNIMDDSSRRGEDDLLLPRLGEQLPEGGKRLLAARRFLGPFLGDRQRLAAPEFFLLG